MPATHFGLCSALAGSSFLFSLGQAPWPHRAFPFSPLFSSYLFSEGSIPVIAKSHTSEVYQQFGRDIRNIFAKKSVEGSILAHG